MSEARVLSGQCLCGAVKFTASPQTHDYTACYCDMCRRWSAGAFNGVQCGDTLDIENRDALASYKSSDWAQRHFCLHCGTVLFYSLNGTDHWQVSIEAFDDTQDFRLARQLFVDRKPSHYDAAKDVVQMTGDEAFAAYSAAMGGETN